MSTNKPMTAEVETALQQPDVRLVLIGRFDIISDPLKAWTGPGTFLPTGSGDGALDGETFVGLAPYVAISGITENQGIGGPVTLTISGEDLDEPLLRQIVRDKRQWRGQPAYLWWGLLNTADGYSVIADPVRMKSGIMVNMVTNRGKGAATVSITIDEDLGNAKSAPYRWIDHVLTYSTDTFSSYVVELANKPNGFGIPYGMATPAGGGGSRVTIQTMLR
ncbi:hypothetical protein LCGC14_1829370 [marine sediment metagenome]|uniref:Uncharacterized protein n=1 Tax=marine sediment metagenome TaxID=412755 RepID=A0A0F9GGS7_9ZZZZ